MFVISGSDFALSVIAYAMPASPKEGGFHRRRSDDRKFLVIAKSSPFGRAVCNSRLDEGEPVCLYIFSGTLILNMVSTLKMAFFTPMHRARRACCTAGSAP